MSILDRLPDFGERVGRDGEPVDEFAAVLMHLPQELGVDGVMLASAICQRRCHGGGDLDGTLARWWPENGVRQ